MADLSDILLLINLATGESSYDVYTNWGEVADANFAFIEDALGEVTSKALAANDIILSDTEERSAFIKLSGTLTANVAVKTNDRKGFWFVQNDCTGDFTVTFRTASGDGVEVPQGGSITAVSDGTDMYSITPILPEEISAAGILTKLLTVDVDNSGLNATTVQGLAPADLGFPEGTAMLFVQTAAPTGWTKSTTHNDKALRIVSGTAGTGGTVAFATAFASKSVAGTVGTTALALSQIPSHQHTVIGSTGFVSADHTHFYSGQTGGQSQSHTHAGSISGRAFVTFAGGGGGQGTNGGGFTTEVNSNWADRDHVHAFSGSTGGISANHFHSMSFNSGASGSGGGHTHSFTGTAIDLAVQYVDAIIAIKD